MLTMTKPSIGARLKLIKDQLGWSYPEMQRELGNDIPWQTLRNYIEENTTPMPIYEKILGPILDAIEKEHEIVYDD